MAGVIPVAAALGISETVWLAILAAVRAISWVLGIAYVSAQVKDVTTGITQTQQQASQDATVEGILANPNLSATQKKDAVDTYLATQAGKKKETDWSQTLLIAVGILAAAYIASSVIGGKK